MDRLNKGLKTLLKAFSWVIVLLVIWQIAAHRNANRRPDDPSVPGPRLVFQQLRSDLTMPLSDGRPTQDQNKKLALWQHVLLTLWRWGIGFSMAILIGVALGLALGVSNALDGVGYSCANFLRAIPSAVLWPGLIVLGYGLAVGSQLILITFGAVWPILFDTRNGIKTLPTEAKDSLKFLRLKRWFYAITVLRWSMPSVFTGLEIGCAVAFLLAVTVEIFIPDHGGIGWYVKDLALENSSFPRMYAGIIVTGVVGLALNTGLGFLRRILVPWESERRPKPKARKSLPATWCSDQIKGVLQSHRVSEYLKNLYGSIRLDVLYQGRQYLWPSELKHLKLSSDEKVSVLQRDVIIWVGTDHEGERVGLFARSWIATNRLGEASRLELEKRQNTIGTIIGSHYKPTYKDISFSELVSERLSRTFRLTGAHRVIRRTRMISVDGRPTVLIQEHTLPK